MKTFEFEVPCTYHYVIKARSEKEARKILVEKGGIDIQGRLCLEEDNYRKAIAVKQYGTLGNDNGGCSYNIYIVLLHLSLDLIGTLKVIKSPDASQSDLGSGESSHGNTRTTVCAK